jgi:hypothetical protein
MAKNNNVAPSKHIHDVHLVISPKGGVGKSFISSLLAQFSKDSLGQPMKLLDLDQSNTTLARLKALGGQEVSLLTDGRFDSDKMDGVMNILASESGPFLLDVGASVFQDVWRYFVKYQISSGLQGEGRRLIYHVVLAGGTETVDGLAGFRSICAESSGRQVVAWVNPVRGPVNFEGKDFLDMKVYKENEEKVLATILLPLSDEATMNDLSNIGKKRLTLDEVNGDASIFFPSKQRLRVYRSEVFKQIGAAWPLVMGAEILESADVAS